MCLILFAKNQHQKYKLIVAANRDEFYKRKTTHADFWDDHTNILAGRDLQAGGTWMGVNKNGLVSMLTNFRDLKNIKDDAPSRGHLVSDFLKEEPSASSYLQKLAKNGQAYNGFNLICGNGDELYYYGNYQTGVHKIQDGTHGLSNALLNTSWPKVERGKQKLQDLIDQDQIIVSKLFATLYDDLKADVIELPDTGVGIEMEKMLSPMFIKSTNYGSRCSTVLLVDNDDNYTYVERTYNIEDFSYTERDFHFTVN